MDENNTWQDQREAQFTGQVPTATASGLSSQPQTLAELGEQLQRSICSPKECPHCHKMIANDIEASVRTDEQKQTITAAVSLAGVLRPLRQAGAKYEVKVHPSGSILFIKMKRGE